MRQLFHLLKKYQLPLLAVILVGAMTYSFLNQKNKHPAPSPAPLPTASESATTQISPTAISTASTIPPPAPSAPPTTKENIISLINSAVLWPSLDSETQTIYYFDENRDIYSFSLADRTSTKRHDGSQFIERAAWSADHQRLLLQILNGTGNQSENPFFRPDLPYGDSLYFSYTLATEELVDLNANIATAVFSGENEILYQFNDGQNNNISTARPDGKNWRNIGKAKSQKVRLAHFGPAVLIQEDGVNMAKIYQNGRLSGEKTLPQDMNIEQSAWNNSGTTALYLTAENGITLQKFMSGKEATVQASNLKPNQMTILWDNKTGAVYIANVLGLNKLEQGVDPQN